MIGTVKTRIQGLAKSEKIALAVALVASLLIVFVLTTGIGATAIPLGNRSLIRKIQHTVVCPHGQPEAAPPVYYRIQVDHCWEFGGSTHTYFAVFDSAGNNVTVPGHFVIESDPLDINAFNLHTFNTTERHLVLHCFTLGERNTNAIFYVRLTHGQELWIDGSWYGAAGHGAVQAIAPRPGQSPHATIFESAIATVHSPSGTPASVLSGTATTAGWQVEGGNWSETSEGRFQTSRHRYSWGSNYTNFVWNLPETTSELYMTKTLVIEEGLSLPAPPPSFDFYFDPVQVNLENGPPAIQSRPVADFASLVPNAPNPLNIAINPATGTVTGSSRTYTGQIDLWEHFSDLADSDAFPRAGVYVWNVSEVHTSSGVSTMIYCNNHFQLRVWICRDGRLDYISVYSLTGASPNFTLGQKQSTISFLNRMCDQVRVDLEITKHAAGQFAVLGTPTPFIFNLALTGTGVPASITAHIYAYNTATLPAFVRTGRTVTITGGSASGFTLYHGDTLRISGLPVGTNFAVTEHAVANFSPEVHVYIGAPAIPAMPARPPIGTHVHTASAASNTQLATGTHALDAELGRNVVRFTNTFEFPPPDAGLSLSSEIPLLLVGAIPVFTLTAYISRRNRKAIEELTQ